MTSSRPYLQERFQDMPSANFPIPDPPELQREEEQTLSWLRQHFPSFVALLQSTETPHNLEVVARGSGRSTN